MIESNLDKSELTLDLEQFGECVNQLGEWVSSLCFHNLQFHFDLTEYLQLDNKPINPLNKICNISPGFIILLQFALLFYA